MLTITARRFSYDELKAKLKADDRIVIVSCDACAKLSDGLGGEAGLNRLSDKLVADGFNVTHRQLLSYACSAEHVMECLDVETTRELFKEADVVIPLACQAGETRLSDIMTVYRFSASPRPWAKGRPRSKPARVSLSRLRALG